MPAAGALGLSLLLFLGGLGGAAPSSFSTFMPPFHGTLYISNNSSVSGSVSTSVVTPTRFSLASGKGAFSGSILANSSSMSRLGLYNQSGVQLDSGITVRLNVPFNNMSGTRVLHFLNVTVNYAASGSYFLGSGVCPWLKSSHKPSYCQVGVGAGAGVGIYPYVVYKNGSHRTNGRCYGACNGTGGGASAGSKNDSSGLTYVTTGTLGKVVSFSGNGSVTLVTAFPKPITSSRLLVVYFNAGGSLSAHMSYMTGRGVLTGASASASLSYSVIVVSVSES